MNKFTHVNKAVFPVAGLGTRFLPATKAQPKEMLPIVDKPLIQYAVEEAYEAGIRHMIFVTGRNKRAIEDHFDTAYELESELEAGGKEELLSLVRTLTPADMDCSYVRQPRSLGLGHAVLCAACPRPSERGWRTKEHTMSSGLMELTSASSSIFCAACSSVSSS